MIIDTGASVNIVSRSFLVYLGLAMHPTTAIVRDINGKLVSAAGEARLALQVGRVEIEELFLVLGAFPYDLLGGLPLCRSTEMVISFPRKVVTFCGQSVELTLNDPSAEANKPATAYSQSTVHIPPRAEIALAVTIDTEGTCLIEPLTPGPDRTPPNVARALIDVRDNTTLIRLANPTTAPVTIIKGAAVAQATPLRDVEICVRVPSGRTSGVDKVQYGVSPDDPIGKKFRSLLAEYGHLFSDLVINFGHTDIIEHEIDTDGSRPVRQNPYRNSAAERQITQDQVTEMLEKGVVRESTSPWSSPVVLVRKRDGTWRFCVDYRKLNAVTKKDVHLLPCVDDVLDMLQGSSFFTTLDRASGYWQVPIREVDKEKTAFATRSGLYQFNVVPFGLCNALATFQRMISWQANCGRFASHTWTISQSSRGVRTITCRTYETSSTP